MLFLTNGVLVEREAGPGLCLLGLAGLPDSFLGQAGQGDAVTGGVDGAKAGNACQSRAVIASSDGSGYPTLDGDPEGVSPPGSQRAGVAPAVFAPSAFDYERLQPEHSPRGNCDDEPLTLPKLRMRMPLPDVQSMGSPSLVHSGFPCSKGLEKYHLETCSGLKRS